jgi:hypothetical protein
MKILTFILGFFSWLITICINITILFIGVVVYNWLWKEIQITYPNQQFHDWFKVCIFFGCILICWWVIDNINSKSKTN